MSKSNSRSKTRKSQAKRLSSTKRKQELEDANVIECRTKPFKNYEKVKRVLDITLKVNDKSEKPSADNWNITSPNFYKPSK